MKENFTYSNNNFQGDSYYLSRSSHYSSNPSLLSSSNPCPPPSINCEVKSRSGVFSVIPNNTGVSGRKSSEKSSLKIPNFPQYFTQGESINIPLTVGAIIDKQTPRWLLRSIDPNLATAIEKCLLFASFLTPALLEYKYSEGENGWKEEDGWKTFSGRSLRRVFNNKPDTYLNIIKVLTHRGKYGPVIEMGKGSNIGFKVNRFRFTEQFRSKKIVTITLKTDDVKKLSRRLILENYQRACSNTISSRLLQLYPKITLPTIEEIIAEAHRIIENGGKIKKGRILIFLNNRLRSYYKNQNNVSFVEDAIEVFNYWTKNGLRPPHVCSMKKGGRVIDSLNMMPSWIRNLVKINGNSIGECDYECLHPNCAAKLYGGTYKYLTHQQVADAIGIDRDQAKIENLSYFNKEYWQMKESPVHPFYKDREPEMTQRLIREKCCGKDAYKIASNKMMNLEVQLMTNVMLELESENIDCIYVFDALNCESQHTKKVIELMNKEALKLGIYTTAKS